MWFFRYFVNNFVPLQNAYNRWLVGWLAVLGFQTVFQSISGRLPERGRKKRETIDERKNVQATPIAPTASTVGPCPTIIQFSRTPGTGSVPSTIALPDHPLPMSGKGK